MKQLLITISALVLAVSGEAQQSTPTTEAKTESVTAKAPDLLIHDTAGDGNIESVKNLLVAGVDVNAKNEDGDTPLHRASVKGRKKIIELLLAKGADVNAQCTIGLTALDMARYHKKFKIVELLRKNGGKTGKELKELNDEAGKIAMNGLKFILIMFGFAGLTFVIAKANQGASLRDMDTSE